jgi:hypothetical protein
LIFPISSPCRSLMWKALKTNAFKKPLEHCGEESRKYTQP